MVVRLEKSETFKLLPISIFAFQYFSLFGIRLSWILYFGFVIFVANRIAKKAIEIRIVIVGAIILLKPIVDTFVYNSIFNFDLYFSIITGIFCMCMILCLKTEEFDCFMIGCRWSLELFVFVGLIEIIFGKYLFFDNVDFIYCYNWLGLKYPGVVFTNPNDLAQYIVLLLPTFFYSKNEIFKYKNIIFVFALFFVLINSSSMLSILSATFVVISAFLSKLMRDYSINKLLKNIVVIFTIIIILFVINNKYKLIEMVVSKFYIFNPEEDYYLGRKEIYLDLLNYAKGSFLGEFGSSYVISKIGPHNLFLFVLCDYGWIVFILFVGLLAWMVIKLVKILINNMDDCFVLLMVLTFIVFPFLSCISSGNEQRKAIWMFIGICFYIIENKCLIRKELL